MSTPIRVMTADGGHYVTELERAGTAEDGIQGVWKLIQHGKPIWAAPSSGGRITEHRWRLFNPQQVLRVEADPPR